MMRALEKLGGKRLDEVPAIAALRDALHWTKHDLMGCPYTDESNCPYVRVAQTHAHKVFIEFRDIILKQASE